MRMWIHLSVSLLAAGALASCDSGGGAYEYDANETTPETQVNSPATTTADAADQQIDQQFVNQMITAGMKEIQVSQIAERKASSPEVKAFAERMVRDHQQANEKLRNITGELGVDVAPDMQMLQQAQAKLSDLSGGSFDRQFMQMMVQDHEHVVKTVEAKVNGTGNGRIQEWASSTLPTLRDHLDRAREIERQLTT
jgi:putative membrane protein